MQKKKWIARALHILVWAIYFSLPHLMRPEPHPGGMGMQPLYQPHSDLFWFAFRTMENILLVPLFYLFASYCYPHWMPRKKYLWLFLALLTGLFLHLSYGILLSSLFQPDMPVKGKLFMGAMSYVLICSVAYGYYAARDSRRREQKEKEREVENMKAELQFLRWQISPHFLFNALNNMVALARKKSDNLEPMLLHLSGLMRYMIYETDEKKMSLDKEAEYLQSFIRLQSLRSGNVALDVHIDVSDSAGLFIEPMLLIPFVENAFKHGIDLIPDPVIKIRLAVKNNTLHFEVSNKYIPKNNANKDDAHGVGLANVQKRLNLLYGDRHSLQTTLNGYYTIHLRIDLTCKPSAA